MREGEANLTVLSGGDETEKEEEEKQRLAWPYIGVSDPSGVLEGARSRWHSRARENGLEASRRLAGAHAVRCPCVIRWSTVAPPQIANFKLFLSNYS
jgi:hypothetical protein